MKIGLSAPFYAFFALFVCCYYVYRLKQAELLKFNDPGPFLLLLMSRRDAAQNMVFHDLCHSFWYLQLVKHTLFPVIVHMVYIKHWPGL